MDIPSPRSTRKARIEIIPLIDIIFFLLATFVMVSLSMVKSKGLPVNLPIAATGEKQDRSDFTSITVSADNTILFNRLPVTAAELTAALEKLKAGSPDPKIFLNGDADSRLGVTIGVLDEIRRCGISKVAFETKPK
ncbi:MAG: biopolymer transportern ExbD [Chthoniobacteraceae bacterium]|nr:biopolymer transportern ExbD [Chthoniobacteraceae bacterium]